MEVIVEIPQPRIRSFSSRFAAFNGVDFRKINVSFFSFLIHLVGLSNEQKMDSYCAFNF